MTTYARLSEAEEFRDTVELTSDQYHAFDGNPKQRLLRPFITDAKPVPLGTQTVQVGPIVVELTQVRQTWILVDKTAAELAAETEAAERIADVTQIMTVLTNLKNGTGTSAERLARLERVVFRLAKDALI